MRLAISFLVLGALAAAPAVARAEDARNPVGRWMTIDDSTHRAKSIVRLWEKDKVLYGNIETLFPAPGEATDPICDKCEGALKNKPIKGMLFMWGFKQDDDEWTGGRIVDPENGKVYRCWLKVVGNGRKLKVRGYVGISVLGRTQVWERADADPTPVN